MDILAAGDIINNIFANGAYHNFQPSAGTEIIITQILGNNTETAAGLYNGTNRGTGRVFYRSTTSPYPAWTGSVTKLGITNTNYLSIYSDGGSGYASYSGIQIK